MAEPEFRQRGAAATELVLGAAVLLTRLPFLGAGYGTDPDAWRVAWTGRAIVASGAYQSSRAPGNPIPELAAAALWGLGPWALNGLTALFGAAAVVLFARLLRRLGCRAWIWGALALAFTPAIANNSVNSMDYMWALGFVLAGLLAALEGRAAAAGVLLGLAAGCRITSLALLPAFAVAVGWRGPPGVAGRVLRLSLLSLATAAAAFAPVIARYGTSFLHGYEHGYPPAIYVIKNLTVDLWGVPGTLALAGAMAAVVLRRRRSPAEGGPSGGREVTLAALLAIAAVLAVFLRVPHEAEYLIPAVPFVLLLLARALPPRGFALVAAGLVLSSLTLKVSEPGKPDAVRPSPLAATVRLGGRALVVDPLIGPLLHEHLRRVNGVRFAERVRTAARRAGTATVVVAYEWLPVLRVLAGASREGATEYVYLLDRATLEDFQRRGFTIADLPGAEGETWTVHGFGLREAGSRPFALPADPDLSPGAPP